MVCTARILKFDGAVMNINNLPTHHREYLQAVIDGDVELLKRLQMSVTSLPMRCEAVDAALIYNQPQCLAFVLTQLPSDCDCSVFFHNAIVGGQKECIEIIVPYIKSSDVLFQLHQYARNGYKVGFDALFARIEHDFGNRQSVFNEAILSNNHYIFHKILPSIDPKHNNSLALQVACMKGHRDLVDLLYPLSDPYVALEEMKQHKNDVSLLKDKIAQHELKEKLKNATQKHDPGAVSRKM